MQRRVMNLELEWGDFLDVSLAREDRERKRRLKALKDSQAPEQLPLDGVTAPRSKDDLRQRLRASREKQA